jgi:hypothetical protein
MVMKLELTNEQVTVLQGAILTRIRLIENLLDAWKIDTINESTEYLIDVYSKELESINEIRLKFNDL